jgi:predicted nucleic acid-binding protein
MPAKIFIDANILVYAHDKAAPKKQQRSRELLSTLITSGDGVLSTQVLQEYYVAATRKLGVAPLAAKAVLKTFAAFEVVQVTPALIQEAVDCSILNQLSFWDALIVAAADAAGCTTLYSEDFNSGQMILGVKVVNPYKS